MTFGQHMKKVIVLGLPLIGGHLAQIAIGLTDTVMLGWYGVPELAALTIASGLFFVFFFVGSGFGIAVMPLVASFAAAGDAIMIRRVTRMGIWLSILAFAAAMPVLYWSEAVLLAAGQEPETAALAQIYLRIAGWGMLPALAIMTLKSFLAGLERTQVILWISVLAAIFNALGNYVLIFGRFGFPELGITGAAIASLAMQILTLLVTMVYIARSMPVYDLFARFWRTDWEMFRKVFRLGLPIGLTSLSEGGLFMVSSTMMGWLGTQYLAAHGIALQLASITFMVHLGLSSAATVRAGNAYSRADAPHLSRGAWAVYLLSVIFSVLTMIVFLTVPEFFIGLFLAEDSADRAVIISVGVGLLAMAALFQLVDGAQVVALGVLRGVQDTKVPMIMAAIAYWLFGFPASYWLGFQLGWGAIGIWAGLVVGLLMASVLLTWRFWTVSVPQVAAMRPNGAGARTAT